MTASTVHEAAQRERRVAMLEAELTRAANLRSNLADALAATQAELADAVRIGTELRLMLRAVSPNATDSAHEGPSGAF